MAKNQNFEQYMDASYPPGSLEARYIDDAMRYIKEGVKQRMDQEHYWRSPDEGGYTSDAEGAHRPQSARVWVVDTDAAGSLTTFPTQKAYTENALYRVHGKKTLAGLAGTAWFAVGTKVRQLVEYVRGKFRVSGMLHVGPNPNALTGVQVGSNASGYTYDEDYPNAQASISTDNITLYPYLTIDRKEAGAPDDEEAKRRTIWPIRVGKYDPATNTYTPEAASEGKYGVGFAIGDWPNDGSLIVLSRQGVEVFSTDPNADVFFNGLNVRKHDHSGEPGMGEKITLSNIIAQNPEQRLVSFRVIEPGGGILSTNLGANYAELKTFASNEMFDPDDPNKPSYVYRIELYAESVVLSSRTQSHGWTNFKLTTGSGLPVLDATIATLPSTGAVKATLYVSKVFKPGELDFSTSYTLKVRDASETSGTCTLNGFRMVVTAYRV